MAKSEKVISADNQQGSEKTLSKRQKRPKVSIHSDEIKRIIKKTDDLVRMAKRKHQGRTLIGCSFGLIDALDVIRADGYEKIKESLGY